MDVEEFHYVWKQPVKVYPTRYLYPYLPPLPCVSVMNLTKRLYVNRIACHGS